jgi:hypothetical protein
LCWHRTSECSKKLLRTSKNVKDFLELQEL